jgi:microcystin-dependent protein
MGTPFLAEIKLVAFGFPPKGWAFCNGQLMPINQNQALFSLVGTTYGGDGRINFGLPNLQGRTPIHMGSGFTLGQLGGEQNHTLTTPEMPTHNHVANASTTNASGVVPAGSVLSAVQNLYGAASNLTSLLPSSLGPTGGSQTHNNSQPYLTLNFCIALQGIFPTRN